LLEFVRISIIWLPQLPSIAIALLFAVYWFFIPKLGWNSLVMLLGNGALEKFSGRNITWTG